MIDKVWPLLTAVLAANLLTVMFFYGMKSAIKAYTSEDVTYVDLFALIVPLAFLGIGSWLYW